jgi:hypothetical protein
VPQSGREMLLGWMDGIGWTDKRRTGGSDTQAERERENQRHRLGDTKRPRDTLREDTREHQRKKVRRRGGGSAVLRGSGRGQAKLVNLT